MLKSVTRRAKNANIKILVCHADNIVLTPNFEDRRKTRYRRRGIRK
jgi:hypothetical protein